MSDRVHLVLIPEKHLAKPLQRCLNILDLKKQIGNLTVILLFVVDFFFKKSGKQTRQQSNQKQKQQHLHQHPQHLQQQKQKQQEQEQQKQQRQQRQQQQHKEQEQHQKQHYPQHHQQQEQQQKDKEEKQQPRQQQQQQHQKGNQQYQLSAKNLPQQQQQHSSLEQHVASPDLPLKSRSKSSRYHLKKRKDLVLAEGVGTREKDITYSKIKNPSTPTSKREPDIQRYLALFTELRKLFL